jgi:HAD superfamily hydrolase (TIGR01509 family)
MTGAVLFDMDGVLVDSEELTREAAVMMFREKGYKVQPEDFIPFAGVSARQSLGGVARKYGIPFHAEKDKARTYQIYEQICRGRLSALPGVFETLDLCRSRGIKTAVATSADEFKFLVNLKAIGLPGDAFDVSVTAEMIKDAKPNPEIYLTASGMLGMQPSDCLVVEDAPSGLQAAAAAGMKSLALTTSFPPEELGLADWIIPDLSYFREEFLAG